MIKIGIAGCRGLSTLQGLHDIEDVRPIPFDGRNHFVGLHEAPNKGIDLRSGNNTVEHAASFSPCPQPAKLGTPEETLAKRFDYAAE